MREIQMTLPQVTETNPPTVGMSAGVSELPLIVASTVKQQPTSIAPAVDEARSRHPADDVRCPNLTCEAMPSKDLLDTHGDELG